MPSKEHLLRLPADLQIDNLQQVVSIVTAGRWLITLYNEMRRMAVIFTLMAVLGGVFLDRTVKNFIVNN